MNELIIYLAVSVLLNLSLFIVAFRLQSDKLTDASYALSFIILIVFAALMSGFSWYVLVGALLICVWALRIGIFLVYRVIKTGKDARFDAFRSSFFRFMRFWLLQAVTAWVLLIPLFFAFRSELTTNIPFISIVGAVTLLIGVGIEAVADSQKWQFSQVKSNKGKWIGTGIWRYSRHPNYFGEILVWVGVFLYSLPVLSTVEIFVALVSPLLITSLLLFVTGIPLLEKSADKRWGGIQAYKDYKYRTSILIPFPPKRK